MSQSNEDSENQLPVHEDNYLLSREQLTSAVNLACAPLVGEVYETIQTHLKNEQARQTTIESKATALLSAVGLVSTLAFAFVGTLLNQHAALDNMPNAHKCVFVGLLIVAVVSAIVAGGFAITALLVSNEQLSPNERAIFHHDALRRADVMEDDYAVRDYRRYLVPHIWRIAQRERKVLNRKGRLVATGQKCFFCFIACVGVLAVIICGRLLVVLGLATL